MVEALLCYESDGGLMLRCRECLEEVKLVDPPGNVSDWYEHIIPYGTWADTTLAYGRINADTTNLKDWYVLFNTCSQYLKINNIFQSDN